MKKQINKIKGGGNKKKNIEMVREEVKSIDPAAYSPHAQQKHKQSNFIVACVFHVSRQ